MLRYIAKRLLFAIPTIVGVFVVVFFVIRLIPGDPAVTMLGPKATEAQIVAYRAAHGLNDSVMTQFGIAINNFIRGDLGFSLSLYRPVLQVILERFPRTAELAFFGIIIGFILAVFFGVIAAVYRGRWPDIALISFSTLGMSLPTFYIGLWVLYSFALKLKIIPVISSMGHNVSYWQSLLGPLVTIAIGETALLLRTTRSSMLEVLNEDFIRTARAKGIAERVVLFKHALGNSLIPIVTVTGYSLATAFGGAIVLETVFARQGIGKLLIDAITVRDYPLVQGTTIIIAILMILVNIITDVIYGYLDPRIRISNEEY
ncbi:MAG: ABC transporter permease [Clostridiales bacterium]|nr:ABC transporter permease [Clostridiales bacterium]